MYAANILVAGWISITSLFHPTLAHKTIFSGSVVYSETIRLVGALWGAVFILSLLGLAYPKQMSLVLLFQLIYKSSWLIFVAIPAIHQGRPYPKEMALFFLIWVVILPFIIPWAHIFQR